MPLIPALSGVRDPAWRDVLLQLLDAIEAAGPLTPPLAQLIANLRALDAQTLDAQADAIFAAAFRRSRSGERAVHRGRAASRMDRPREPHRQVAGAVSRHPRPVPRLRLASGREHRAVGGAYESYRYLQCGLCATEWHMVRSKCSNCDSTKGIAYHALGAADADQQTKDQQAK